MVWHPLYSFTNNPDGVVVSDTSSGVRRLQIAELQERLGKKAPVKAKPAKTETIKFVENDDGSITIITATKTKRVAKGKKQETVETQRTVKNRPLKLRKLVEPEIEVAPNLLTEEIEQLLAQVKFVSMQQMAEQMRVREHNRMLAQDDDDIIQLAIDYFF